MRQCTQFLSAKHLRNGYNHDRRRRFRMQIVINRIACALWIFKRICIDCITPHSQLDYGRIGQRKCLDAPRTKFKPFVARCNREQIGVMSTRL